MKAKRVVHSLGLILSFLALALMMIGCSENKPTESESPPELPPQSSFIMDFNDFQDNNAVALYPDGPSRALSHLHWGRSALLVGVWDLVLTVTLAVPVASFVAAFQNAPVRQADGSWNWTYSFASGGTFTAALNGKIVDNQVLWTMSISRSGDFTDFVWYTGASELGSNEGTWTLNLNPNDPTPFLYIEWQRNPADSTANLKYTNIIPGNAENGSYIYYGTTTDTTYDRFYHIYARGNDNLTEIEWNFDTKAGRIQDEHFYGDTDWRCWNGNLEDSDCP